MHYQELTPIRQLSPYVKCIWVMESDDNSALLTRQRILPDGCIELIIHYGDGFDQYHDNSVISQPRGFVFGQISQFIEIAPTGRVGIIAVRFHPGGTQPFLRVPTVELAGKATELDEVFGSAGVELEEKIIQSHSTHHRITLLQEFLMRQLKHFCIADNVVNRCVNVIVQSQGQVSVEKVAHQQNISTRQLERRFGSVVGISPKLLSRIIRFRNVFHLAQSRQINSLTALAHEAGYYDQSHFIKEFRHFAGHSPTEYFLGDNPLSDAFTSSL